jgi:hypothetical protein
MKTKNANGSKAGLSTETVEQVKECLKKASDLLDPYLKAITTEERKSLLKMSDKSVAFVEKTCSYVVSNPEFAPPYLDVAAMQEDLKKAKEVKALLEMTEQLRSNLDDTTLLSGSEAFSSALVYYRAVQHAAKSGVADAKPIVEDLQARFYFRKRKAAPKA